MADLRYTGAATAVAQVDTFTPANVEVDDIFTLTITGWDGTSHAINFTATAATVANVTAGIAAAWNASTHPLCTPITATDNTTTVSLAADTAGEAFSVASTETDGGGTDDQTFTRAATTASAGPKHWDDVNNWDTGALPGGGAGENVYIDNDDTDILYGLNQSGIANTLTSLNIGKSFTGKIGYNGAAGHSGTYLQIKATAVNIGEHRGFGSPTGSGRIMINTGSTASTITIDASASQGADTSKPSIRILANSASSSLDAKSGNVGVSFESGESTTIGTVKCNGADVFIGSGATVTTLQKKESEGRLFCESVSVTTLTIN